MKRGMLFVSFGTSHEEARIKTIDAIQDKVHEAFPNCVPYSAWTSKTIIKKVAEERAELHDTVEEALARMSADGVEDLIVSTTCMLKGGEMALIKKAVTDWAKEHGVPTQIADPLLATDKDRAVVAQTIIDEFSFIGKDDALLLMGHGSCEEGLNHKAVNAVYGDIQDKLHAHGRPRFFVATVEGTPTFEDALTLIDESRARCVYLAPLMIVAGDHAKNDMAGEGEDSWASQLKARGLQVKTIMKGLGEYASIQQLVCNHVNDALTIREISLRG